MKNPCLQKLVAAAAWLVAAQSGIAQEGPEFRVSGFGTLGYVTTNTDMAVFKNGTRQLDGATKDGGHWGVDSRLGLQVNAKFNETFSAVGQLLTTYRDGSSKPVVEWLYGQAKVTDWADVRVGRLVLPVFMVSDSRNVGYASHWLRAPQEVYGFYSPTSFDGVQGVFHKRVGDANLSVELSSGQSKADVNTSLSPATQKLKYNSLNSVDLVVEQGNWTGRVGYTRSDDFDVESSGVRLFDGDDDTFIGVGGKYDDGTLVVMAEYVSRNVASDTLNKAFDADAYYLSAGYRMGQFTPYFYTSTIKPKGTYYTASMGTSRTNAVGVRWDVMKNVALKAQVEEAKGARSSLHIVPTGAMDPGKKVRAFSVAADFVF